MKIVKAKYDPVFKKVFADPDNADILRGFLADMLRMSREEIGIIEVLDQELIPDKHRGKVCRLDMRVNIDNKLVNVELQINHQEDYRDRTLYYWSKMFSDTLREGDEYGSAKECICINILGFDLFDTPEYCSEFGIFEKRRHEMLSDKLRIYFFEMGKLRKSFDPGDPRELWLKLIDSESEEEFRMIEKNTKAPEMKKAMMVIRHMSSDERKRNEEWFEEQMKRDEASLKKMWKDEGRAEGRAEGIVEGREEGREEGRAEAYETFTEKLRANGFSPEMISSLLSDSGGGSRARQ